MASHGYTYVPSKDVSPNVRMRDEQIRAMDFDELKAYMRAMHEEMNATAAKFQRLCTFQRDDSERHLLAGFRETQGDAGGHDPEDI